MYWRRVNDWDRFVGEISGAFSFKHRVLSYSVYVSFRSLGERYIAEEGDLGLNCGERYWCPLVSAVLSWTVHI